MKKFVCVLIAAFLMLTLASAALAFSYDESSGRITGSYSADGNVEIWLDGRLAGGSRLSVSASEGSHTVQLYVDGQLVKTETVVVPGKATQAPTEAPTAEPTEAPTAEPTEVPTEAPTDEPVAPATQAPTQAPAEPTEAPTKAPTAAPTTAPTADSGSGSSGSSDVPKTGDTSNLAIVGGAMALAAIGLAATKAKSRKH